MSIFSLYTACGWVTMKVSINSRRGSLPMSKKQSKLSKTNVVKPRKVLLLFVTPLILVTMIVGGFLYQIPA